MYLMNVYCWLRWWCWRTHRIAVSDMSVERVPFSRVVERSICLDTNTHAWCAICSQYERQVCPASLTFRDTYYAMLGSTMVNDFCTFQDYQHFFFNNLFGCNFSWLSRDPGNRFFLSCMFETAEQPSSSSETNQHWLWTVQAAANESTYTS